MFLNQFLLDSKIIPIQLKLHKIMIRAQKLSNSNNNNNNNNFQSNVIVNKRQINKIIINKLSNKFS